MQRLGGVLLQLRWNVPENKRADFEAWYDKEHLHDMAVVPGILGGRRFARVENRFSSPSPFTFLTLYQLADEAPLTSPEYGRLSTDPSPWTMRAAVGLDLGRTLYRRIGSTVDGPTGPCGPAVFHVMMSARAEIEDEFTAWYDEEHVPAMLGVPGILGARRFRAFQDDAGFGVHPEQADFAFLAVYELESLDVVDTPEFSAAGRRTPRRERLGTDIRAHVQTYRQVFPEGGAYEVR